MDKIITTIKWYFGFYRNRKARAEKVLKFLSDNQHKENSLEEIMAATGFSENQIKISLSELQSLGFVNIRASNIQLHYN